MREIISPLDGIRSPFGFIRGGVVPFSPLSLFASGEEGAWYEPSTTTAFLGTTDLTPCGYGDACGFLLDKSQGAGYSGGSFTGLGSEFASTWQQRSIGTFSASGTGFDATKSQTTSSEGTNFGPFAVSEGKQYLLKLEVTSCSTSAENWKYILTTSSTGFTQSFQRLLPTAVTIPNSVSPQTIEVLLTPTASSSAAYFEIGLTATRTGSISVASTSLSELPGNHATQATEAARPILARVPSGGRRNLLEKTEQFDDAVWDKFRTSVDPNTSEVSDPLGGNLADKVTVTVASAQITQGVSNVLPETNYVFSFYARRGTGSDYRYAVLNATNSTFIVSATSYFSQTSTSAWVRISVPFTTPVGCTSVVVYPLRENPLASIYLWGAQLEAASSATAYQKVVDQYDITEAGVTSLEYLAFDGSDDGMATASIDFTATDKMSVFAGVEKDGDTTGMIAELSADYSALGNTGSFFHLSGSTYAAASRGSATADPSFRADTATASGADTAVVSALHDISGDSTIIRRNGTASAPATGDKGTGNFGNYPLYLGARGGSSIFFDGKLFSLIVRGAASTAGEISDTESYVANLSGVTL